MESNIIVNFGRYYGKKNFHVQGNFNANTTTLALFEIRFRSLLFDVEKNKIISEVKAKT